MRVIDLARLAIMGRMGMGEEAEDGQDERPRVLIVDDESGIRNLLCRLLDHHGYEATSAVDAEDAMTMVEASAPDLIISDMVMPGMSGDQLMQAVRENIRLFPL